jgi:hypothetical protein
MKLNYYIFLTLIAISNPVVAKSIGADCGLFKEKVNYALLTSTSSNKYESVQTDLETMKSICFQIAVDHELDIETKKNECSSIVELDLSSICYLELADYITQSVPWF